MSKGTITGGGDDGLYTVSIEREKGSIVSDAAYCADLTEDLSGKVGIIEIAGDRDKGINIQPGYEGNAAYNATRDGELYLVPSFPPKEGHQAGVYWNWAMRPGWQKWKPNYRYGTITEIDYDADTCSVALDACLATDTPDGQVMDINQGGSLGGVPIQYMSCNSAPFVVGDEVLVKFEGNEWGGAKVIGFKQEPKGCFWEDWVDGICGKHTWILYTSFAGEDDMECPSSPQDRYYALSDPDLGKLIGQFKLTDNLMTLTSLIVGQTVLWCDDPELPNINKMTIKVPKAYADSSETGNISGLIRLKVGGNYYWFELVGNLHESIPFVAFIGINGGDPLTVTLSDYSIPPHSTIDKVEIICIVSEPSPHGTTQHATVTIDYINFTHA